jgi:hypothetical protein
MAVVITAELPGGTAELDQAVLQRLNLSQSPAPGSLVRIAGPTQGGWRVISVWESQEAFDQFRRERLEPALQAEGRPVPQFQVWPVESVLLQPR